MKKTVFFTIVIFLFSFHSFSEIVSWKGMEMGLPQNPKWLQLYKAAKNEKLLRKKFDIDKAEKVVVGIAAAPYLEEARSASQFDAQSKATALQKDKKNRLVPVYEYWEEDDKNGFTVYSVYTF